MMCPSHGRKRTTSAVMLPVASLTTTSTTFDLTTSTTGRTATQGAGRRGGDPEADTTPIRRTCANAATPTPVAALSPFKTWGVGNVLRGLHGVVRSRLSGGQ